MRVLACCDYFHPRSPGGAERVAAEVYRRLAARGDVEILVAGAVPGRMLDPPAGTDARAAKADDLAGVALERIRGVDLTGLLGAQLMIAPGLDRRIRRAIARFRPDVVHVNGLHFHSTVAGVRAARRSRVPVVATAHLGDVSAMPGRAAAASVVFDRVVGGRAARASDAVVAVSESVRTHLLDLGVAAAAVTVVPNGVDHDRFGVDGRADRTGELRVAFVGRLVANKGPLEALDAVARARVEGHDIRLEVYGDGPLLAEVRRRSARSDLAGHVGVHGAVDDIEVRLRSADVLLRPSYSEGLPLAVLEAMASGVVPVASDVAGNAEVVGATGGDDAVGIVVPIGDTAALARALGRLDDHRCELEAFARRAVVRAGDYSWDRSAAGHLAVWQRAVTL